MKPTLPITLLALALFGLTGCETLKCIARDISTVSAQGSYTDGQGHTYAQGIAVGFKDRGYSKDK